MRYKVVSVEGDTLGVCRSAFLSHVCNAVPVPVRFPFVVVDKLELIAAWSGSKKGVMPIFTVKTR